MLKRIRNAIVDWKEKRRVEKEVHKKIERILTDKMIEHLQSAVPPECKTCRCLVGFRDKKSYKLNKICRDCYAELENVIATNPRYSDSTIQDLVDAIEVMNEMSGAEGRSIEAK
ncbi:MAG: hypothetical protein K0R18_418 [Bacillales bacterium]|jgi:hypothetical protein|nr:hypothetical protein [Bacillales bacterium]